MLKLSKITEKKTKEECFDKLVPTEMNSYPDLFWEIAVCIDASGDQANSVNISSKS